jgi:hypothetical protein
MGVEPMNTGFADQRVSHFATGASVASRFCKPSIDFAGPPLSIFDKGEALRRLPNAYFGCGAVRI